MEPVTKKRKPKKFIESLQETQDPERSRKNSYTVSIALPGSIMNNAQSQILKSYLVGQIARAASIFCINEIVVFHDSLPELNEHHPDLTEESFGKYDAISHMAYILQYLECPQYLRKKLYPKHPYLSSAGVLNPLDLPHHLRKSESKQFREGITLPKGNISKKGSIVDIGLDKVVKVKKELIPGIRVTVELNADQVEHPRYLRGKIVPPSYPYMYFNMYWGYSVRIAKNLSAVLNESPFSPQYDLIIGTSDKGANIDCVEDFPLFKHLLIVFGGLNGLEAAAHYDKKIKGDLLSVFDFYLNTCPNQGSRVIRTEEAIFITLSALRGKLFSNKNTAFVQ